MFMHSFSPCTLLHFIVVSFHALSLSKCSDLPFSRSSDVSFNSVGIATELSQVPQDFPASQSVLFGRGDFGKVLKRLAREGGGAKHVKVSSAFFGLMGYNVLADSLKESSICTIDLLLGYPEGMRGIERVLQRVSLDCDHRKRDFPIETFKDSLTNFAPTHRTEARRAGRLLHAELTSGSFRIRKVDARLSKIISHAKIYLFDSNRGVHGSANLSWNGLMVSVENCQEIRDNGNLIDLHKRFDSYFEVGTDIGDLIDDVLLTSWIFCGQPDAKLLLIKCLQEMGLIFEPIVGSTKFKLGPFQRAIAQAILLILGTLGQALVIAPTGCGKTVIGAHLCAVMKAQEHKTRALVSAPNQNIFMEWKKTMRDLDLIPLQINHRRFENKEKLMEDIQTTDSNSFLIVDEAHHFRNVGVRYEGLKSVLWGESTANSTRPTAVLFTATPISTSLDQAQNLVALVASQEPQDSFRTIEALRKSPYVITCGLPDIVQSFGADLDDGSIGMALEFAPGHFRYFPQVRAQVVLYNDTDTEWIFDRILALPLNYRWQREARGSGSQRNSKNGWHQTKLSAYSGFTMLDDSMETETSLADIGTHAAYDGRLVKIGLLRAAESSPDALNGYLRDLQNRLAQSNSVFEDPTVTETAVSDLLQDIDEWGHLGEAKWIAFQRKWFDDNVKSRILNNESRVLIFTSFKNTAHYIRKRMISEGMFSRQPIAGHDHETQIEAATSDLADKQKVKLAHNFSSGDCKILVTTDTFSEGYNLHSPKYDTIVINFELYWTPLRLVQRVGRVDRPSDTERTVTIWNIFPGAETLERLEAGARESHLYSQFEQKTKMLAKITDRMENIFQFLGQMSGLFTGTDYVRDLQDAEGINATSAEIYAAGSNFSYREEVAKVTDGTTPWVNRLLANEFRPDEIDTARKLPYGACSLLPARPDNDGEIIALVKNSSDEQCKLVRVKYDLHLQNLVRVESLDPKTFAQEILEAYEESRRRGTNCSIPEERLDCAIELLLEQITDQDVSLVAAFAFVSNADPDPCNRVLKKGSEDCARHDDAGNIFEPQRTSSNYIDGAGRGKSSKRALYPPPDLRNRRRKVDPSQMLETAFSLLP